MWSRQDSTWSKTTTMVNSFAAYHWYGHLLDTLPPVMVRHGQCSQPLPLVMVEDGKGHLALPWSWSDRLALTAGYGKKW